MLICPPADAHLPAVPADAHLAHRLMARKPPQAGRGSRTARPQTPLMLTALGDCPTVAPASSSAVGACGTHLGSCWAHDLGSCWTHVGLIWAHVGLMLGACWTHAGLILPAGASACSPAPAGGPRPQPARRCSLPTHHAGLMWDSCWAHVGLIWADVGLMLGSCWIHLGSSCRLPARQPA